MHEKCFYAHTNAILPASSTEHYCLVQNIIVSAHEGIRSERLLMRYAADRLSVRWYIGCDMGEPLPNHSSLTRIRDRYGVEVFWRPNNAVLRLHTSSPAEHANSASKPTPHDGQDRTLVTLLLCLLGSGNYR